MYSLAVVPLQLDDLAVSIKSAIYGEVRFVKINWIVGKGEKFMPLPAEFAADDQSWWTVTFRRRKDSAFVEYVLKESDDLRNWTSVDPDLRLVGPPVDLGGGMEQVTVHCPFDTEAPDSPLQWFMRIAVKSKQ